MAGLRRSPHASPSRGHGEGSFLVNQVALELLNFTWKAEEAQVVALGMSFLAEGRMCEAWEA